MRDEAFAGFLKDTMPDHSEAQKSPKMNLIETAFMSQLFKRHLAMDRNFGCNIVFIYCL